VIVAYFVQYKPVDCQIHEIFIYDDSVMGPENNSGPKKQEETALDEHLLRLLSAIRLIILNGAICWSLFSTR
jgi:sulfur relay (sulfurtransferase) complex TusBCD TusD component (DsrE family)